MITLKECRFAVIGEGMTAAAVKAALTYFNLKQVSIEKADYIVTSPGIPPKNYPQSKAVFISELDLAYLIHQENKTLPYIIAITGSNGKSTVTAMLAHLLDTLAMGNIGRPFIESTHLEEIPAVVVVEVSSFQSETSRLFNPNCCLFLNLTPDHLDRHGSMQNYCQAKLNLLQNSSPNSPILFWEDDPIFSAHFKENKMKNAKGLSLGKLEKEKLSSYLKLPGVHNLLNALFAITAATIYQENEAFYLKKLSEFSGIEHRIEKVKSSAPFDVYNDSKATNPESTITALKAFSQPCHLILGGYEKNLDMTFLYDEIQLADVKSITVFGQNAQRLDDELKHVDLGGLSIHKFDSLDARLKTVLFHVKPDEIVLFSPATSSFDQFKNFEERGRYFKTLVKELYPL